MVHILLNLLSGKMYILLLLNHLSPIYPYQLEKSAYWLFGVRHKHRDELIIHLKKKGIATGVHFLPLPLHPLFKSYDKDVPIANKVWKEFVTLPLFPDLTEEEIDYVIDALNTFTR